MGIFQSGRSKYAYTGELTCPFGNCNSKAIKYVEHVSTYRLRYRCRKCGLTFQYDISNQIHNPYARSGM
jgi:transposase-like protein